MTEMQSLFPKLCIERTKEYGVTANKSIMYRDWNWSQTVSSVQQYNGQFCTDSRKSSGVVHADYTLLAKQNFELQKSLIAFCRTKISSRVIGESVSKWRFAVVVASCVST